MSTIAASTPPVSSAPVSAPVAVSQPSDVAQPNGGGASDGSDPFGPAVVVDLSPAAAKIVKRPLTADESVEDIQNQWTVWAKKQGKSDQEIETTLVTIDQNIREGWARLQAGKEYENQVQNLQPNLVQKQ